MSTAPDNDLNLDLLFLPAWAQESSAANRYAKYEGGGESDRGERRGRPDRPGRRSPPPDRGPARPRDAQRGGFQRPARGAERPERGRPAREQRAEPAPLPQVNVALIPDERGVESLARQIRMNGRAYPLFHIAQMILEKPERHSAMFSVVKKPDGTVAQPLFVCALDDTLWLSEDEAVAHVLGRHFETFYQTERTATEAPKGTYTFVAQCGLSGVILGPPNYHNYQTQLHKLHTERFSRMPFDVFKARVKIVRDEAVVKKWIDDQSWKTEFVALNVPEAVRLGSREEVEKHFRQTHLPTIIKPVETHAVAGGGARNLRGALARLYRYAIDEQRRFPLQIATVLSQQFASHGLQFFKVNKTVTHVSVARPHFLDMDATPVSEGVKRIVDFINATPKCTRRRLLEAIVPASSLPPADRAPAPPAANVAADNGGAKASESTVPIAAQPEPGPEVTAVITDLHWLIHQGHVIEFATGILETAKKPAPRPVKPDPKAATAAAKPANKPATPAASIETADSGASTAAPAPVEPEPNPASFEPPLTETAELAGLPMPVEAATVPPEARL